MIRLAQLIELQYTYSVVQTHTEAEAGQCTIRFLPLSGFKAKKTAPTATATKNKCDSRFLY